VTSVYVHVFALSAMLTDRKENGHVSLNIFFEDLLGKFISLSSTCTELQWGFLLINDRL